MEKIEIDKDLFNSELKNSKASNQIDLTSLLKQKDVRDLFYRLYRSNGKDYYFSKEFNKLDTYQEQRIMTLISHDFPQFFTSDNKFKLGKKFFALATTKNTFENIKYETDLFQKDKVLLFLKGNTLIIRKNSFDFSTSYPFLSLTKEEVLVLKQSITNEEELEKVIKNKNLSHLSFNKEEEDKIKEKYNFFKIEKELATLYKKEGSIELYKKEHLNKMNRVYNSLQLKEKNIEFSLNEEKLIEDELLKLEDNEELKENLQSKRKSLKEDREKKEKELNTQKREFNELNKTLIDTKEQEEEVKEKILLKEKEVQELQDKINEELAPLKLQRVKEIAEDYKEHFPQFDEILDWIVACRFTYNRRSSFLHLRANAGFGKSFFKNIFGVCNVLTECRYDDFKSPSPLDTSLFQDKLVLMIDEFKVFKQEFKDLTTSMKLDAKYQLRSETEVFAKIFLSAEKSVSFEDGADKQIKDRVNVIDIESSKLEDRELFKKYTSQIYMEYISYYTYRKLKSLFKIYLSYGREKSVNTAEILLNNFHTKYKMKTEDLEIVMKNHLYQSLYSLFTSKTLSKQEEEVKDRLEILNNEIIIRSAKNTLDKILNLAHESFYKKAKFKLNQYETILKIECKPKTIDNHSVNCMSIPIEDIKKYILENSEKDVILKDKYFFKEDIEIQKDKKEENTSSDNTEIEF